MRFDAHFGDAEALQLKAAILLYGGAKRIAFASVHEPCRDPEGGAPYLDAGRPISMEFLRTVARRLGLRDGAGDPAGVRCDADARGDSLVGAGHRPADVLFGDVGRQDAERQNLPASAVGVRS